MNKQFAWFLGTLLSDGSITRPTFRGKGNEDHIQYCIHNKDIEMLYKIKTIINTNAKVHEYPNYKSPQCKIRAYDRKDIIKDYSDIKTKIPDNIIGFERHFIRGIVDGDGCLYHRKNRYQSNVINLINEEYDIMKWYSETISKSLLIPYKEPTYRERDHIYIVSYEGRIANLIIWWLYHGEISDCVLKRKYDLYKEYVLESNEDILDYNKSLLIATKAQHISHNHISPNIQSDKTLDWCHRLQKYLSFNTVPVFHNKGKTKYYELYIPEQ